MNKGRLGLGENKMNTIMRGGRRKKKTNTNKMMVKSM
jgi:hypothetical protein